MKKLLNQLIESVLKEMAEEESAGYPSTAEEYAKQINNENPSSRFKLAEPQQHWEEYGIKTGYDLAKYLAIESYITIYKDTYGFKPRGAGLYQYSIKDIKEMTDELLKASEFEDNF